MNVHNQYKDQSYNQTNIQILLDCIWQVVEDHHQIFCCSQVTFVAVNNNELEIEKPELLWNSDKNWYIYMM